jgi:hypothetical protein
MDGEPLYPERNPWIWTITDSVIDIPEYTGRLFEKKCDTVEVKEVIFYSVNGVRKVKIK